MSEASAVERLFRLFGEEKFKIGNIKGAARIRELASLLDVCSESDIGRKSLIGKGLNKLSGRKFRTSFGTLALDVCREAEGSVPAIYRVRPEQS